MSNLQIRHYIAASPVVSPVGFVVDTTAMRRRCHLARTQIPLRDDPFRRVTDGGLAAGGGACSDWPEYDLAGRAGVRLQFPAGPAQPSELLPPYQVLKNAGFVDAFRTKRPSDPASPAARPKT